jgi:predicted aspartyl protease
MKPLLFLFVAWLAGCSTPGSHTKALASLPMQYFEHTIAVPVKVGDRPTLFIIDTGIGLPLIAKSLCEKLKCQPHGKFTAKRMSGQNVTVDLTTIESITVGGIVHKNVEAGIFDLSGMPIAGVEGFLSLGFFEHQPFTMDYAAATVWLETPESLAARKKTGVSVPVEFDRNGPSLGIYMRLELPKAGTVKVEVDTGSDSLILDQRFMRKLAIGRVKRRQGKDETGHSYVRSFSELKGNIFPAGAPQLVQHNPPVMFQKIIYDGLIGHSFMNNFVVTYDLSAPVIIFNRP